MQVIALIGTALLFTSCATSTHDGDWPDDPRRPDVLHFPCDASKVALQIESDPDGPLGPRPLFQPPADYPPEARRQGAEGWVELRFTIDSEGRACDAWVEAAEPPLLFDRSALESLKQWRFEPVVAAGRVRALTGARTRIEFRRDATPTDGQPASAPPVADGGAP